MQGATGMQGPQGPPGDSRILDVTIHQDATRVVLPIACSITLESFLYNKVSSTSILMIEGSIAAWGNASGSMNQGWRLGTGTEVIGQPLMFEANPHSRAFPTRVVIAGHTTTGPQIMTFRYFVINTDCNNRPFVVYNPNASDDTRLGQTRSVYTIWEIEP